MTDKIHYGFIKVVNKVPNCSGRKILKCFKTISVIDLILLLLKPDELVIHSVTGEVYPYNFDIISFFNKSKMFHNTTK
jgi:hypothetical protein